MNKYVFLIICCVFFLASCASGNKDEATLPQKKTDFFVDTYVVGKKIEKYSVEKPARLTAGSSVSLNAESLGEVSRIAVKEGQKVRKGAVLVSLRDTVNSYDIRLAQAENTVAVQDASIASTKLSLDKAISDAEIAYEQAKKNYDTLLAKNSIISENLINTNQKTLQSHAETYKNSIDDMERLMTNFLYEGDRILGMTSAFQYTVDGWKPYLGAKVGNARADTQNQWNNTYASRGDIRAKKEKGSILSPATLQSDLDLLTKSYSQLQVYADSMLYMLQNNVIGGGLSQSMHDGWMTQWNTIKSQIQASQSAYTAWKAQSLSFFTTYQITEKATQIALESLSRPLTPDEAMFLSGSQDARVTYENTRIDLKDKIRSLELALKQAETARETAKKNKSLMLTQLETGRNASVLSLNQAQREYAKLAVVAPFDGTITKVMTSVGQRTNMGTPLLEIVSNNPEILIDVEKNVIDDINIGDEVTIVLDEKPLKGAITAMSRNAGANLLYTVRISVPGASSSLGSAVKVVFSLSHETISSSQIDPLILPLSSVKILSEQEGEVAIIESGSTLAYRTVSLGRVIGEGIEIIKGLNLGMEVILSDMANYDPTKFILTKKN